MAFLYPYGDSQQLNLSWFLAKFKELYEYVMNLDPGESSMDTILSRFTEQYNPSTTYTAGDYCIFDGYIYKANRATSGMFDSGSWDAALPVNDIQGLRILISELSRTVEDIGEAAVTDVQYTPGAAAADGVLKKTINGADSTVMTVDKEPTENSQNPVKSGSVYGELSEIKGSLNTVENDVLPLKAIYATPAWTIGSLSTSDGTEASATNQIRSSFIRCANGTRIGCADGYQFIVCLYDINTGVFAGTSGSWTSTEYVMTAARWARIVARRVDQSTISSASDASGNIYIGDYELGNSVKSGSLGQLHYCKLPDGVMIQWGIIWRLPQNSRAWGTSGLYIADFSGVTFPEQFIATPAVNISPNSSNYSLWVVTLGASATGIGNIQSARATAFDNLEYVFGYTAIGRWK